MCQNEYLWSKGLKDSIVAKPTCGMQDIAVTMTLRCMCLHASITSIFKDVFHNSLAQLFF